MGLTNEQKGEIRAAYRDAANPKKQITILAQLYATSKEEICKVLGIEAPQPKPKKTLRSYEQAVKDDVVKAVLLEGATYQEAAERFGVPYGNVNAWVNKARKKQAEFGVTAPPPEAPREEPPAATAPQPLPAPLPPDAAKREGRCRRPAAFSGCLPGHGASGQRGRAGAGTAADRGRGLCKRTGSGPLRRRKGGQPCR
ncbi:MAG: sigma-70 region 4 domain-containing protein [Fournierella sp.]|uniref:sigma-70 region 4 domain-containing protein n=1 Tax=Allofournierella sp. TaxID=1940256 RepID=UPI002A8312CF|nr:sigma-70 region 4 domain-containing protein [Fournierella sp.]MDY4166114.1 sigma-70 region 4 domain-containing protein [Fournierella sp.]